MSQIQEVFLFNPTQISGCSLWLDAADRSTFTFSGANITAWNDKSGGGWNATQSTASNQPTFSNNAVTLSGNQFMFTSLNSSNTQQNVFGIVSSSAITFNHRAFLGINSMSASGYSFYIGSTGGSSLIQRVHTWGGSPFTTGAVFTQNQVYLYGTTISGTACTIYSNGSQSGSGSVGSLSASSTYLIGAGTGNTLDREGLQGTISEIIVYNTALSTSQRQQIEGYLAWKWGLQANLPSDHPFKNYRPLANTPIPTSVPNMPIVMQNVAVFAPTQVSGCRLWFDGADSSSMLLSGVNVIRWNDKSGNTNNAATTGASYPTYDSSSRSLVFNGAGTLSNTTFSYGLGQRSVFIVGSQNVSSVAVFEGFIVFNSGTTLDYNSSNAIVYNGRGSNVNANCSFGVFFNAAINSGDYKVNYLTSTTPVPLGIYTDIFSTNSGTLFVNGSNIQSDTTSGGVGTSTGFLIGGRLDTGTGVPNAVLRGNIYEIIAYNTALSLSQRQQVEGYLAWKWDLVASLPNGHPYKRPPIAPFPARVSAFNGNMGFWRPTQISNCALWLDGADTTRMTFSNEFITSWTDKMTDRLFITGFSNVTAPTFSNGGVYFNSALNQGFRASNTNFTLSGSFTMMIAHNLVARGGNNTLLSFTSEVNTTFLLLGNNISNTFRTLYRRIPAIAGGLDYNDSVANTYSMSLYSLENSNQSLTRSFNTVPWGTTNAGGYFSAAIPNIDVGFLQAATSGANYIYTRFQNGFINEILIYSSFLTTQQRQQVEGYLAWKWNFVGNLPANHPYKKFPPSP